MTLPSYVEDRPAYAPLVEVNTLMGVFLGAFLGIRAVSRAAAEVLPPMAGAVLLLAMFVVGLRGWAEHRLTDPPRGRRAVAYAAAMGAGAAAVLGYGGLLGYGGAALAIGCWAGVAVLAVLVAEWLEI